MSGRATIVRVAAAAAIIASLFTSCAAPRERALTSPLIWDVAAQRFVGEDALVARLAAARFRLLGEIHDNPEHHRIRADLIERVAATGVKPAVVFEQFDLDRDAALVAAQASARDAGRRLDAEALATAGGLDRKGWMWPFHEPVIAAALKAGLPVRAGNLGRAELMRAARASPDTPIEARWAARFTSATWTPEQDATMSADIADGHCGKLPPQAVRPIVRAQRMRDAAMAQALIDAATPDGAILIAGNGHVRRDVAVPAYLDVAPREIVSMGLIETDPQERAAATVSRRFAQSPPPYDYVWLTDAAEREDPCAAMPAMRSH